MRSSVGDYDPPVVQFERIVDPVQPEVIGALRGPGRQAGLRADLPAQARIQRWTGVFDDDDAGTVLDLVRRCEFAWRGGFAGGGRHRPGDGEDCDATGGSDGQQFVRSCQRFCCQQFCYQQSLRHPRRGGTGWET